MAPNRNKYNTDEERRAAKNKLSRESRKRTTHRYTLDVPWEHWDALATYSDVHHIPIRTIIMQAIEEHLQRDDNYGFKREEVNEEKEI